MKKQAKGESAPHHRTASSTPSADQPSSGSLKPILWAIVAVLALGIGYKLWNDYSKPTDLTTEGEQGETNDSDPDPGNEPATPGPRVDPVAQEEQRREELDSTIWAKERLAQEYEQYFVQLWDQLRDPEADQTEVLRDAHFQTLAVGEAGDGETKDWNILLTPYTAPATELTPDQWSALLDDLQAQGFRLVESEWHHSNFDIDDQENAHSKVSFLLHVVNDELNSRYAVRGVLGVDWEPRASETAMPVPQRIAVEEMKVMSREGTPAFTQVEPAIRCGQNMSRLVLVYDLDDDGLPEIVVPATNTVYRNTGDFNFYADSNLTRQAPSPQTYAAVLADFNNDGRADLMTAAVDEKPLLYLANSHGRFTEQPLTIEAVAEPFIRPSVITTGDINGDGNLDVWIGQYRDIFEEGQMPTPYYDANDGFPAYLLLGDGQGGFTDATEESGLAPKRFRRTYSASLVDLNGDDNLDLAVSSDYAGLDVYYNDGTGHFTDVTQAHVDEADAFGMGFTFGDYNHDDLLDLYLIGMSSTTARRLTAMGLGRQEEEFASYQEKRPAMGYGNRLLLGTLDEEGGASFRQAPFNDDVARTGWSWGTTSFDFDNDGDRDIYVANGFKSRRTAKDYCTRFWTHDIYTGSSEENPELARFFEDNVFQSFNIEGMSWNGFEHNCLYLNEDGEGFSNIAFVMNSALENDSREVVGADFNADGRVDLLVGTVDPNAAGTATERNFRVLANNQTDDNHWIGLRLSEQGQGFSPIGAEVVLEAGGQRQTVPIVAGDSIWCQHPTIVHFGLGEVDTVDSLEIHWPNGQVQIIAAPQVDSYNVAPPMVEAEEVSTSAGA